MDNKVIQLQLTQKPSCRDEIIGCLRDIIAAIEDGSSTHPFSDTSKLLIVGVAENGKSFRVARVDVGFTTTELLGALEVCKFDLLHERDIPV